MPSPIAHSITGFVIYQFFYRYKKIVPVTKKEALYALFFMLLAVLADLDFIPQLLTGEKYHRGFSHSIFFTVCMGAVLAIISKMLSIKDSKSVFFLVVAVYGSHLLLDFFSEGGAGIQLLWPFSKEYYASPMALFPGVHHSRGVLDISHFVFIGFELCYSALIMIILWFFKKKGIE